MEYEKYTKKELAELIRQMKEKLKEVKTAEKAVNISAEELVAPAIGLHKDKAGQFFLVDVRYDIETKAGTVSNMINLHSRDPSIASFKLKEYVIEKVFRKTNGGKYNE